MTWIDWLVHLIINSALRSHNRGKTMNYANESAQHVLLTANEANNLSPTDSSLMRLNGMLDNVEGTVAIIEQRLSPILSPGMKGEIGAKPQAVGASPVVDNILRTGDRTANIDERLRQLIERLTV